jgi:hypothetical protein
MKKTTLLLLAAVITSAVFAQSDKYIKAMEPKVAAIDTAHTPDGLQELANSFERIADAEKTEWTAYYYAALAHADKGLMIASTNGTAGGLAAKTDPEADKAEELLNKAEALTKDNSEIEIVKKQIATLRLMADPMNRYMVYGPAAQKALEAAKKLNPENPRIYLLEGQDKFYTPEQYGGSKEEAKKLFAQAQAKFEAFKPENSITPNWGRGQLQYMLSQQ